MVSIKSPAMREIVREEDDELMIGLMWDCSEHDHYRRVDTGTVIADHRTENIGSQVTRVYYVIIPLSLQLYRNITLPMYSFNTRFWSATTPEQTSNSSPRTHPTPAQTPPATPSPPPPPSYSTPTPAAPSPPPPPTQIIPQRPHPS